ncbi:hypothetical protein [Microbacterium sp. SLBN-146]|uniref:hypothetical protein n=1 Tax=Microbacterium sp. SLBN-146 TaxID=2768457 RepID=UPI00114FF784|nr:hypothetical protein [Microbacterium sp. SLBN-146]TQJ29631.1 hypothetical protein FBY39_0074 [Microbacterium sp. SLBN-146]
MSESVPTLPSSTVYRVRAGSAPGGSATADVGTELVRFDASWQPTVYNTLAAACEITGDIRVAAPARSE